MCLIMKRLILYVCIIFLPSFALAGNYLEYERWNTPENLTTVAKNKDIVKKNNVYPGYSNPFPKVAFGEIDTISSTIYDWQYEGPSVSRIVYDPNNGLVHILLIWSDSTWGGDFPDRRVVYNCYSPDLGWIFGQGMDGGIVCYPIHSGSATLDVLSDSRAVVAFHIREPLVTLVGVDNAPGMGAFNFVKLFPEGIISPRVSRTLTDKISVVAWDWEDDYIYTAYSLDTGVTWTDFIYFDTGRFHNQFASKVSDNVCIIWVQDFHECTYNSHIMYSLSSDGGQFWGDQYDVMDAIPVPTGNTYKWNMTRHADFGGFGMIDHNNNLHIVFSASFGTRTGPGYYYPFLRNPIWHYSTDKAAVSLIAMSSPSDFPEGMGTLNAYGNAHLADKPSIGEDFNGYLYCVWQEFPPEGWDLVTAYPADAEIYAARSMDGGKTWGPQINLTMTEGLVENFPCFAKVVNDTLHLIYQHDLGIGTYVCDTPYLTDNPFIYHRVPVIPGDIEVVSLDDPPHWPDSTSYTGETYIPKATYHNKGTQTNTFQARFEIESPSYYTTLNDEQDTVMLRKGFYYDIVEVTLLPDETEQVSFAPFYCDPDEFTEPDSGFSAILRYIAKACFLGDMDIHDNTLIVECQVNTQWEGSYADIGPCKIVNPPESVYVGQTYNPGVYIKNFHTIDMDSFNVICIIDTTDVKGYFDTEIVRDLAGGDSIFIDFDEWVVPFAGKSYQVTFFTQTPYDSFSTNDTATTTAYSWTGIEDLGHSDGFPIIQCFPNPFSERATIDIRFQTTDQIQWASVCIYDLSGRLIRTLPLSSSLLIHRKIIWDGRDDSGRTLPCGVYFLKLDAGKYTETQKLIKVR